MALSDHPTPHLEAQAAPTAELRAYVKNLSIGTGHKAMTANCLSLRMGFFQYDIVFSIAVIQG
jgi:hypothetical protein